MIQLRFRGLSWIAAAGWSFHCGAPSPDEAVTPEAPADRESWGEHVELIEPGLRAEINTPYMQYHGDAARADSGVGLLFQDDSGDTLSHLVASRLAMDAGDRVSLAGGIAISAGDSFAIHADSLIWERSGRRLLLPGKVAIEASRGGESGRNLETDLEFRRWTMGQVNGNWSGTSQGEEYLVEVSADSSVSERLRGSVVVEYSQASVRFDGAVLRSPTARYVGADGTITFQGGVSSADSVEQLTAGELHFKLGERSVRATGHVRLRRDDWSLEAGRLHRAGVGKPLVAAGSPLLLRHGEKRLEASELEYRPDERVFKASGNILFRIEGTELEAAKLLYDEVHETVAASGGVAMKTPDVEGRMIGQSLLFDLGADSATFSGSPKLVRGRNGSPLVVEAGRISVDLESKTVVGEEGYSLLSEQTSVAAERGRVHTVEDVETMTVSGSVEVVHSDGVVTGDSMVVHLENGKIADVEIPGVMEARAESPTDQTTWIKGREGVLFLTGGRVTRIELGADSEVLHNDAANGEVSQISGRRMELAFDATQGLSRIDVAGAAEFASRLAPKKEADKPSLNEVGGEELAILLDNGEIDKVIITKAQGELFPRSQARARGRVEWR